MHCTLTYLTTPFQYPRSRNLSASCLLDESAHVRLCSRLRFTIASCLDNVIIKITACSMDLKRLIQLANIDHHGLAENPSCRPPSGESNEGDPSQSKGEVISICQLKDLFSLTNQKLLSEILDQLVIFYIASINHCTEAISFHNQSVKELSGVFNSASLAIDNALGSLQGKYDWEFLN